MAATVMQLAGLGALVAAVLLTVGVAAGLAAGGVAALLVGVALELDVRRARAR